MSRLLLRLYPARWRERYGMEFASLLAERSLAPFDVLDVVVGAMDAHIHLRSLGSSAIGGRGYRLSVRVGAYAALWTGILWFFGEMGYNALFIAGSGIAFVVALLGLSYGSSGVRATRLWPPAAIGTAAGITIVGGGVAIQLNGWDKAWTMGFPIFLLVLGLTAAYASSLMFTVNLLREGKAGRTAARLLRVGSALGVATMASFTLAWASGSLASIPAPVIEVSSVVAMILFAVGWIAVGVSVLLRDIAAAHELSARNQPA